MIIGFAISWLLWSPIVLPSRVSGWSAWLLYYAGVVGPTLAAVFCSHDRKALWERIVRWRVPLRWYFAALLLPFVVRAVALIGSPLVFRPAKEILPVALLMILLVPIDVHCPGR